MAEVICRAATPDDLETLGVQRLVLWPSDVAEGLYAALGFAPSRAMDLNL